MRIYLLAIIIVLAFGCNNNTPEKDTVHTPKAAEEKPDFFPVTNYILGQIHEIRENYKTPIKYITVNHHTDSIFLKFEDLNNHLTEFLTPRIDSANLAPFFAETKFMDQTINAFTLTYEPKLKLPDSIALRHWDVYIDPETGKVKRIFLVKKIDSNKKLQLTWQSNEWCMATIINNISADSSVIEKEEKIIWEY
jgi:hypothetical protein